MTESLPVPGDNNQRDRKGKHKLRDEAKKERSDERASSEGKPRTDNPNHPSYHAHIKTLREVKDRERDY